MEVPVYYQGVNMTRGQEARLKYLQEQAINLIMKGLRKSFLEEMKTEDRIEFLTLYRLRNNRCFICGREECECIYR